MELAKRLGEMEFILYGREGDALVEEAEQFKYLGRPLGQTCNDWPVIIWNMRRVKKFWGRPGKMLWREGLDTQALEMFYRVVLQEMLLFGSESWVLLAEMERMV